jgi:F-type H+-transporting ATPase subunit b
VSEFFTNFGIDWKLLLAQVVNFFLLLLILKKFAYKPLIGMLNSRKKAIEDGIKFSEESEAKLANVKVLEKEKLDKAKAEALEIVSKAEKLGDKRKEEILLDAQMKCAEIESYSKKKIEQDKETMLGDVKNEAKNLVNVGIMKALGKMEPTERDRELIKLALEELKAVGEDGQLA